jgi:methylated-DNA-[protein]-cysteine S-methyltransferase
MDRLKAPYANARPALDRLAERAAREGLIDVAFATCDSPFGTLLAAVTERGLVRIAFGAREAVLEQLAASVSPRVLEAPARVDDVRRELDEYFDGRRRSFGVTLDWTLTRGFSRRVLEATWRIPFGSVATYGHVAGEAGNARAARAAGTALHHNPIPIVVPCHRVIGASGSLVGYGGGLPMKEALLRLEGAIL